MLSKFVTSMLLASSVMATSHAGHIYEAPKDTTALMDSTKFRTEAGLDLSMSAQDNPMDSLEEWLDDVEVMLEEGRMAADAAADAAQKAADDARTVADETEGEEAEAAAQEAEAEAEKARTAAELASDADDSETMAKAVDEAEAAQAAAEQAAADAAAAAEAEAVAREEEAAAKEAERLANAEYLGHFTLTAYCHCARCCGRSGAPTASGVMPKSGHTVAMAGLEFGSQLLINGTVYTVEDLGTAYGHVDIFMDSHEEALQFGMQSADVYLIK